MGIWLARKRHFYVQNIFRAGQKSRELILVVVLCKKENGLVFWQVQHNCGCVSVGIHSRKLGKERRCVFKATYCGRLQWTTWRRFETPMLGPVLPMTQNTGKGRRGSQVPGEGGHKHGCLNPSRRACRHVCHHHSPTLDCRVDGT